jgi:hypothetical protein
MTRMVVKLARSQNCFENPIPNWMNSRRCRCKPHDTGSWTHSVIANSNSVALEIPDLTVCFGIIDSQISRIEIPATYLLIAGHVDMFVSMVSLSARWPEKWHDLHFPLHFHFTCPIDNCPRPRKARTGAGGPPPRENTPLSDACK